eukprot:scaffold221_cov249-Pinguiococcus_pyrenoidosus.AAC.2
MPTVWEREKEKEKESTICSSDGAARCDAEHHPDRGGDPEQFKLISEAYETLSDEEKRKRYDEGGKEAVENGGGGGAGGPEDVFSAFFGGGGRRDAGPKQVAPMKHVLRVGLEDLYNGKTSRLAITRDRKCGTCNGSGVRKGGVVRTCGTCNGRKVVVRVRQIGPMIQQVRTVCPDCNGTGVQIREGDRCPDCKGKKLTKDRKVLEVYVEKGMKSGDKIVMRGEGNEEPDVAPGDIVFVVEQREHDVFKRKGADLLMVKKISLSQALCGFTETITHLDDRVLTYTVAPGSVIKDQSLMRIEGEGMPIKGDPLQKGNLFIVFKIVFPESLSPDQVERIAAALGAPEPATLTGDEEEVFMEEVEIEQFGQTKASINRSEHYDEDDEDGQGPGGVQCQQM